MSEEQITDAAAYDWGVEDASQAIAAYDLAPGQEESAVDGTKYSPSWRALARGNAVHEAAYENSELIEAYDDGVTHACNNAPDGYTADWRDGILWVKRDGHPSDRYLLIAKKHDQYADWSAGGPQDGCLLVDSAVAETICEEIPGAWIDPNEPVTNWTRVVVPVEDDERS